MISGLYSTVDTIFIQELQNLMHKLAYAYALFSTSTNVIDSSNLAQGYTEVKV